VPDRSRVERLLELSTECPQIEDRLLDGHMARRLSTNDRITLITVLREAFASHHSCRDNIY
jgi:hypothetical protein